jgi:hypothetical protein
MKQDVDLNKIDFERIKPLLKSKELIQYDEEVRLLNPRYREIPTEQRKTALALIMTGQMTSIPTLEKLYLKRKIPKIDEFLTSEYIGEDAVTLFPQWRRDLCEVFAKDSTIRKWLCTGAIGTGKSSAGIIAHLYNIYRINSLRRPQLSLGGGSSKPMTCQLFTVTVAKAHTTLMDRVVMLLRGCKNYVEVRKLADFNLFVGEDNDELTPWCRTYEGIEFPHGVKIFVGSQDRHALGEDVFGGLLDEAEFRIGAHGEIEKAVALFDNIYERIRSRYIGAKFTLMTIISSIRKAKGVMSTYISQMSTDPGSKISQYSIWDTKYPSAMISDGHFWVMRGTQRHPSRVLIGKDTEEADKNIFELPPSCSLIKVPNRYKIDFELRTEESLMNLAGQASMGQEIPFDDLTRVEDNRLCPTLYFTAPLGTTARPITKPLRDQLPRDIFKATPDGPRIRRYPMAPRYGHWDGAAVSSAGLAVIHKELSQTGRIIYVSDLIIKINSPNRINLDLVRDFIIDLRDFFGMTFQAFTADQYQSEQLLQKLTSIEFADVIEVLSTVKTRNQYDTLSAVVAQDCLKTGQLRDLWQELEGIYFEHDKPYKQYKDGSHGDLADALCGAVFNSVQNPYDIPINIYETYGRVPDALRTLEGNYQKIA